MTITARNTFSCFYGTNSNTKDLESATALIKGFFDNVNQDWLMRFLGHRIADKRTQRMVKRFLEER
jgi:hypothetical protein